MDPKVLAWAGGDIAKVNVDPGRRAALFEKYGKAVSDTASA